MRTVTRQSSRESTRATLPPSAGLAIAAPDPRGAVVQRMADASPQVARTDAAQRMADTSPLAGVGRLPERLAAGIERLSGFAMDDVEVHHGSREPASLGAVAFARGNQIHLERGRENCLPHEAWHVVQQKQGRVGAGETMRFAAGPSVAINDERRLEREATVMGARAARLGETGVARPASLRRGGPPGAGVTQRLTVDEVDEAIKGLSAADGKKKLPEALGAKGYATLLQALADLTSPWDRRDATRIDQIMFALDNECGMEIALGTLDPAKPADWAKILVPWAAGKGYIVKAPAKSAAKQADVEEPDVDEPDYGPALKQYAKLANKGSKDLKDRIVLECAMGQGVCGDLRKYALLSSGFSTCTPIVLWDGEYMGGLFHWAANSNNQVSALTRLAAKVKPQHITIGKHDDHDPLSAYLAEQFPKAKLSSIQAGEERFVYLDKEAKLQIVGGARQGALGIDLTQSPEVPDELEDMDFGLFAHKKSMAPNLFQGVYATRKFYK